MQNEENNKRRETFIDKNGKTHYRIVRERFEEMIKDADDYFTDEQGKPIYGCSQKGDYKHKLSKKKKQDIACMLHIAPQTLSNNINGKYEPSPDTLKRLSDLYNVSWEWLCGQSKYKSTAEKLQDRVNESEKEAYYMYNAISFLASLNGYEVEIKEPTNIRKEAEKVLSTGNAKISDILKHYMTFRNEETEFSLSLEDANRFGNFLSETFLSFIKWNILK